MNIKKVSNNGISPEMHKELTLRGEFKSGLIFVLFWFFLLLAKSQILMTPLILKVYECILKNMLLLAIMLF